MNNPYGNIQIGIYFQKDVKLDFFETSNSFFI
jgi:hypothetical protein